GNRQYLPHLFQRHAKFFGKLLWGGFAADLVEHFPRHSNDLVGHLDHVHWNANSPSLITDRAGDCLADPPGRVGGELVAAAVIKLVDRPHQPDIPFLYEVKKLQPTIGVFLGDRDDKAQIGLHHFFLRLVRFTFTLLHHVHDLTQLADLEPGFACKHLNVVAALLDLVLVSGNQVPPAPSGKFRDTVEPTRIKL